MSVGADLRRAAQDVADLPASVLDRLAQSVPDAARSEGARAAPRGIDGRRLGARARVAVAAGAARLTVVATPAGPWAIATRRTRGHRIGRRGRVLAGGLDHPVSGPVAHPGGRPPDPRAWDRVADAAAREARAAFPRALREVLAHAR